MIRSEQDMMEAALQCAEILKPFDVQTRTGIANMCGALVDRYDRERAEDTQMAAPGATGVPYKN